jgi:hypothetical protein
VILQNAIWTTFGYQQPMQAAMVIFTGTRPVIFLASLTTGWKANLRSIQSLHAPTCPQMNLISTTCIAGEIQIAGQDTDMFAKVFPLPQTCIQYQLHSEIRN